jgi:hypothetical protein
MPVVMARPNRARSVRHICRLQEPNRPRSCSTRFIGDAVDYVLNQLIETTLLKDRVFLTWRQDHPADVAAPNPRRQGHPTSTASTERRVGGSQRCTA